MPDCTVYEDAMNAAALLMAETSLLIAEAQAANQAAANAYMDALIELELCSSSRMQAAAEPSVDASQHLDELRAIRQRVAQITASLKASIKTASESPPEPK